MPRYTFTCGRCGFVEERQKLVWSCSRCTEREALARGRLVHMKALARGIELALAAGVRLEERQEEVSALLRMIGGIIIE